MKVIWLREICNANNPLATFLLIAVESYSSPRQLVSYIISSLNRSFNQERIIVIVFSLGGSPFKVMTSFKYSATPVAPTISSSSWRWEVKIV